MRTLILGAVVIGLSGLVLGQSSEPPLDDERLSIHTLVREDIFAGWRTNNMERLERGERNLDLLLEKRPGQRADLLAWKGGVALFRAVLAHEDGRSQDFQASYDQALQLFEESRSVNRESIGAASVIGGSYALFADRLPQELRDNAWQASYAGYQILYRQQADILEKMPLHMRGELLAGLTQSALRTGRTEAYADYLEQIVEKLPNTAYARMAKRWQENPEAARTENMSCKTCHAPGRLSTRLAALDSK